MDKDVWKQLSEVQNYVDNAEYDINNAKHELNHLWDILKQKSDIKIKDVNNLKRELKRDGLYTDEMEEFLDNYMRFYNK